MDVMMPVMDGYDATRRIKTLAGSHFVPVIFLTALTDEAALARCIEAGGDDFLTKPYNRVILQSKISALLRLRELYWVREKQRDEIQLHHQRLQQEQTLAERIFSKWCIAAVSIVPLSVIWFLRSRCSTATCCLRHAARAAGCW